MICGRQQHTHTHRHTHTHNTGERLQINRPPSAGTQATHGRVRQRGTRNGCLQHRARVSPPNGNGNGNGNDTTRPNDRAKPNGARPSVTDEQAHLTAHCTVRWEPLDNEGTSPPQPPHSSCRHAGKQAPPWHAPAETATAVLTAGASLTGTAAAVPPPWTAASSRWDRMPLDLENGLSGFDTVRHGTHTHILNDDGTCHGCGIRR